MSLYKLPLFVIFFGSCLSAREIFVSLTKHSLAESTEEAKGTGDEAPQDRKITPETISSYTLAKMASHVKAIAESFRRLLKMIRKWCFSHPPEVKLSKCFASYFNIKIPGLRRNEQFDGYNGKPDKKIFPSMGRTLSKSVTKGVVKRNGNRRAGEARNEVSNVVVVVVERNSFASSAQSFITSFIRDPISELMKTLEHYRDLIVSNRALMCIWDYVLKKFWTWVDSAPDP